MEGIFGFVLGLMMGSWFPAFGDFFGWLAILAVGGWFLYLLVCLFGAVVQSFYDEGGFPTAVAFIAFSGFIFYIGTCLLMHWLL